MSVLKRTIFTILLHQCSFYVFAQSKNTLFIDLENNRNQKIDSLINLNTDKNKLQYLALLPSVNYNFLENNLSVGVSISNLANFYQNKQRNKIELERLRFQLTEKKENDLFLLEKEYELIQDTYEILKMELDNTKLTIELFNLKKSQYDNNKITLEEWLNVQKSNQDRIIFIVAKSKNLTSKMKQFEVKIKSSCFKQELEYLSKNITNQ